MDGLAVIAIAAKAAGYVAALLAMGGVLFAAVFRRDADPATLRLARRIAAGAALAGLVVLALRFGIRAARISGMGLEAATDPTMLGFVWQSPLGTAALWRGLGEAAILTVLMPGALRHLALIGAGAVAVSYAQVGHTLGEPRLLLGALLVAHLLAAAFWAGSLIPLAHAAGTVPGAAVLHRFGLIAAWSVSLLIAAGAALAWLLSGSLPALLGTAYGLTLLAKVAAVGALLGLAALNKWRLVPALTAAEPSAAAFLRRSIAVEVAAVLAIAVLTAALTTVTTPPLRLSRRLGPCLVEKLDQLHELRPLVLAVAGGERVLHAMRGVVVDHQLLHALESGAHGGDLREHVHAVPILLDHPGDPPDLSLEALQARQRGVAVRVHGSS